MKIYRCTVRQVVDALARANALFDNNLVFNHCYGHPTYTDVTLRVIDSRGAGARRGLSGSRLVSACWHAHGTFFDALPVPARIVTRQGTTYPGAPWVDASIGSMMNPLMYSDACGCAQRED